MEFLIVAWWPYHPSSQITNLPSRHWKRRSVGLIVPKWPCFRLANLFSIVICVVSASKHGLSSLPYSQHRPSRELGWTAFQPREWFSSRATLDNGCGSKLLRNPTFWSLFSVDYYFLGGRSYFHILLIPK